jgi:hypothetical protein
VVKSGIAVQIIHQPSDYSDMSTTDVAGYSVSSIWKDVFTAARKLGRGDGARYVVLIQKNQNLHCLTCALPGSMSAASLEEVERVIPSAVSRDVVIISATELQLDPTDELKRPGTGEIQAAGRAIPFFGLALGMAYLGHCVWIFDGQPTALLEGCRRADLLIIDSIKAGELTTKSVGAMAKVMRNENMLIFDRSTRALRLLRAVGPSNRIGFRDDTDDTHEVSPFLQ